jgi:5-formyltetrahydrofolate cyclo-ligase
MVVPSLEFFRRTPGWMECAPMSDKVSDELYRQKWALRREMRQLRRDHAASLDESTRALLFRRPPGAVMEQIPEGATIGLYFSTEEEAPARAYARFLFEHGHRVALPAYESKQAPMHFREWTDPIGESDIVEGPYGPQPGDENGSVVPEVLFVPLVAFTERGERMGQGGGSYDRWLEAHPETLTFGMAWDVQKVEDLPVEPHDMPLRSIITPTRLYGPF